MIRILALNLSMPCSCQGLIYSRVIPYIKTSEATVPYITRSLEKLYALAFYSSSLLITQVTRLLAVIKKKDGLLLKRKSYIAKAL
ncbi:hypothetical protein EDC96DRAFT_497071 [Choanephora cucurbitarum]|nr:hypothetical protein EDC96DRAFT_497071 [Choanephora cucurbitarum]